VGWSFLGGSITYSWRVVPIEGSNKGRRQLCLHYVSQRPSRVHQYEIPNAFAIIPGDGSNAIFNLWFILDLHSNSESQSPLYSIYEFVMVAELNPDDASVWGASLIIEQQWKCNSFTRVMNDNVFWDSSVNNMACQLQLPFKQRQKKLRKNFGIPSTINFGFEIKLFGNPSSFWLSDSFDFRVCNLWPRMQNSMVVNEGGMYYDKRGCQMCHGCGWISENESQRDKNLEQQRDVQKNNFFWRTPFYGCKIKSIHLTCSELPEVKPVSLKLFVWFPEAIFLVEPTTKLVCVEA